MGNFIRISLFSTNSKEIMISVGFFFFLLQNNTVWMMCTGSILLLNSSIFPSTPRKNHLAFLHSLPYLNSLTVESVP